MDRGRKISGGKYRKARKKKHYEKKGQLRIVKLGETKRKKIRMRGGKYKTVLLSTNIANLYDKKTKKSKKVKIKNVLETPSNRFLARQNVLLKGALIDTEIGKARITSRPGQEGMVNAIIVE
jgi:small subunit ribosomal protein S8e